MRLPCICSFVLLVGCLVSTSSLAQPAGPPAPAMPGTVTEKATPVKMPSGATVLRMNPHAAQVALLLKEGRKSKVIIDGKPGPEFDEIIKVSAARAKGRGATETDIFFSTDGAHHAYFASRGLRGESLVVDGASLECPGFEPGYGVVFAEDLSKVAYMMKNDAADLGLQVVVVDAKTGQRALYPAVRQSLIDWDVPPRFINGRLARIENGLYLDGQKVIDDPNARIHLGPNGHYAYVRPVDAEDVEVILSSGAKFGPYPGEHVFSDFDSRTAISPNGARLAIALDHRQYLVDGKPGDKYDQAYGAVFSPDSTRLAYLVQLNNKRAVVVDGSEGDAEEKIAEGPFFGPDSKRVAYIASTTKDRKEQFEVVVDGGRSAPVERSNFVRFTPDGSHVLCRAGTLDGLRYLVHGKTGDLRPVGNVPLVGHLSGITFTEPTKYQYLIIDKEYKLVRIDAEIAPAQDAH